ncbi:MAG TPA: hypothetical protein VNE39_00855 [Planctomycetota bacterium]|nr:hypothetical protein [Planctomycetota bacterium]
MAESLTFRRQYWRVALGTAGAAALCPVLWHAALLPAGGERSEVVAACLLIAAALGVFAVVGIVRAARERVVLGRDSLALYGLLGKRVVRWESVTELAAPWGVYADVPLVVRLRARRAGLLARLVPRQVVLAGHWRDHERLVRAVVARAPHAAANARLRAVLAEPSRVPWPHRAAVLACLAASVGVAGYALGDALAEGVIGLVPGVLVVATAVPCALAGGSMGREWRPKAALVACYAYLAMGLALAAMPAILHGQSDWLAVVLGACLAWAAATLVVCLPCRPRPGAVAALYAAALTAAAGGAWYWGVREPVPVCSVGPLRLADGTLCWSPEGGRLGLHAGELGCEDEAYLVVERPELRTHRLPVADLAERLYLPNERLALYLTCLLRRGVGRSPGARTLWAWEATGGEPRRVPVAPRLRMAHEGLVSPDGQRAVFLAADAEAGGWRLCFLRLADLAVSRLDASVDFSRFGNVRWAADGGMILSERVEGKAGQPDYLALWALAPGDAAPVRFYETTAADLWERHSPDGRWALVVRFRGARHGPAYDLVDLRTRRSHRVEFPGTPPPHRVAWSPDGAALAYAAPAPGGHAVVRFDLETRAFRRTPLTLRGEMRSLALSSGGRFAACLVKGERAARVQVADLETGRLLILRRPMLFPTPVEPSWSPTGYTLAVTACEEPLPPARTVRVRLLDFTHGW